MTLEFVRVKEERDWESIEDGENVRVKEERHLEGNARGQYWCVKIERDEECTSQLSTEVKLREQQCGTERDLQGHAKGSFWYMKVDMNRECSPNKLSSSLNVKEECVKEGRQECGSGDLYEKNNVLNSKDCVHVKIEREFEYDSGFVNEVKHEPVVGPEQLQMQDALKLQVNKTIASNKADAATNWLVTGVKGCYSEEDQIQNKSNENELGLENYTITTDRIVNNKPLPDQKTQPTSYSTHNSDKPKKRRNNKTLETSYECYACGKLFTKKSYMALHIQIHLGVKQYSCDVCKKQYSSCFNLNRHKQIHTGEKPHRCDACDKRFTDPCNLATHIKRIHSRNHSAETLIERKYGCKICNKLFTSPSHLKSHRRVHTGEKPYPCNLCDKQFASASNLKRHKRGHTGEKPYTCDICNKQFMEIRCLTKHIQNHMGIVPIYPCDICKKEFKDARAMARHKQIHKGDTFTCEICNKTYLSSHTFLKHKSYHKMRAEGRYKDCKYIRIRKETK